MGITRSNFQFHIASWPPKMMMQQITLLFAGLIHYTFAFTAPPTFEILCTPEVFECPDGTSVMRDPNNNCEFKECPPTLLIQCTTDEFECPDAKGVFILRDPDNGCRFNVEECPKVEQNPEDPLHFPIHGYDDCLQCLTEGGAVHGKRIDRPRTKNMKKRGITHDRYAYEVGDYCLPVDECDEINDAIEPDRKCFKVKKANLDMFPPQICSGYPDCRPDMGSCKWKETCVDGKLYPTTCGPYNCDGPISETC